LNHGVFDFVIYFLVDTVHSNEKALSITWAHVAKLYERKFTGDEQVKEGRSQILDRSSTSILDHFSHLFLN
jgi:hypothetical protein